MSNQNKIKRLQKNLSSIRKILGWTAEALGEKIDVSKQTISNIENGKTTMSLAQYKILCSVIKEEIETREKISKAVELLLEGDDIPNISYDSIVHLFFISVARLERKKGSMYRSAKIYKKKICEMLGCEKINSKPESSLIEVFEKKKCKLTSEDEEFFICEFIDRNGADKKAKIYFSGVKDECKLLREYPNGMGAQLVKQTFNKESYLGTEYDEYGKGFEDGYAHAESHMGDLYDCDSYSDEDDE
jgi:DNA-binding XRE family transcriptional regulator